MPSIALLVWLLFTVAEEAKPCLSSAGLSLSPSASLCPLIAALLLLLL